MQGCRLPLSVCLIVWSTLAGSHAQGAVLPTTTALGQSKACANHYCQNGGLCIPYIGDYYTCTCQPGYSGGFCQTAETPAVTINQLLKQSGIIPEMMDIAPKQILKIVYQNNNVLHNNMGKTNTPTQVRYQPLSITWPDMKPDRYYTIIMIDPDMPARSTPINEKTQVLHWLMVNIPGTGVGGRQLAPYIGSGPPPSTGVHRYTFFVFDEGTTPKDYTGVKPFDLIDVTRRVNWSFTQDGKPWTFRGFQEWAGLGMPIAGNFYQAQWDAWVDQLWRTFNQYYE